MVFTAEDSTDDNVTQVEELVLSRENKPQIHRSTRQISRECGLSQSSVVRIIHRDLVLRCFKKRRAQELTAQNRATPVSYTHLTLPTILRV